MPATDAARTSLTAASLTVESSAVNGSWPAVISVGTTSLVVVYSTAASTDVLTSALVASQRAWGPNIFLIPGSGLSRLNLGMNSLVATRMPPCAPAAAMPTAIRVTASGSTAQA